MVSYICIYDIINRKTYLKTFYLIPNTFKEWAENFKSLPQYCPVMDIPGGLGGSTQYSILNTLPLDPNPRTLGINTTVGLGQRCCQIYQGA